MRSVKLTDITAETCRNLERYSTRLTTGVYHLTGFRVMLNPETLRLTAYIDSLEGKFHTTSGSVVRELWGDLGRAIKKNLQESDVSDVELEIVPYRNPKSGNVFGLSFRLSDSEPVITEEPIEEEFVKPEVKLRPYEMFERGLPITGFSEEELRSDYEKLMEDYKNETNPDAQNTLVNIMAKFIEAINQSRSVTQIMVRSAKT